MWALKEKLQASYESLALNKILFDIFSDKVLQKYIIELNTQKQLFDEGVNSENVTIGTYKPSTYQYKTERFGTGYPKHYTLNDEGVFFDSFNIQVSYTYFLIEANPNRNGDNLYQKFGKDIVGLTDESIEILIEKILPLIQEKLNAIL